LPDDAECTQASFPATRNPVSSKCATSAAISALTMASIAGAMIPATFAVIAAIAPGMARSRTSRPARRPPYPGQELAMPQVRSQRSGPRPVLHRRIHPTRGLRPWSAPPQPGHSRSSIWCSVTSAFTGGISVTCRRSIPVTRAPPRPAPHLPQQPGSCPIT
jgi:hypothetical protein